MSTNPIEQLQDNNDLLKSVLEGILPSIVPKPAEIVDGSELSKEKKPKKWAVKYGNFSVSDETGNSMLEVIQEKIVDGEFIFGAETQTFDKNGCAYILLKWYEPRN